MAEAGNVALVPGPWNGAFLDELSTFPQGAHDDQVDAASLAFSQLTAKHEFWVRFSDERVDTHDTPQRPSHLTLKDFICRGLGR
jgi:hypothetical protein